MSYELLRLIWWALLGILLIGFAVMDGFDLGAGTLSPYVARTDSERRIVVVRSVRMVISTEAGSAALS